MKFFVNLIIKDKEFDIPINKEPREKGSLQIIEHKSKVLHKLLKHNPNLG